jgi:hypothetical protein
MEREDSAKEYVETKLVQGRDTAVRTTLLGNCPYIFTVQAIATV